MFLKSGDIVVMSEESRLCYHGVPKILKSDDKSWNGVVRFEDQVLEKNEIIDICKDEKLWKSFGDYLDNCRINMNVRQVLYQSQKCLDDKL